MHLIIIGLMNILLLKGTRLIHFGSSLHTLISHIRHVNKVFNILRRLGFLIDANRWVTLIILIKLLIVHPLNCKLDVMDHVLEEARLLII